MDSAVLMTYLFLLANQIFLDPIQSTTQNLLKLVFYGQSQISMLNKRERKATIPRKGNLLFNDNLNLEKYLINVSKLYYSKTIKYRTGNPWLIVET